jgi:hypothetical protein
MTPGQFFSSLFTIPAPIAGVLGPMLKSIAAVWDATWWFFLPLIAAIMFWDAWKLYLHVRFLKAIKWVVLEIRVPKNVLKTPKAMEQIFAAAHSPYSYGHRPWLKYWEGLEEYFFSFELVGSAGETHFYLRTPEQYRNMMEAAIFGQYPDAEVVEVDDYLKEMPKVLPNQHIDVGGFEEVFGKPNWYPLRTYLAFEEPVEEQRLDSIASLVEAMSKMTGDQQFWFQLVIEPAGEDWVRGGEKEIDKIYGIEEKKEHKPSLFPKLDLGITMSEALRGPFEHPGEAKPAHAAEKPVKTRIASPSIREKEITEGISSKIAKLGFKTTIRFVTIERKEEGGQAAERNLAFAHGYIRQFNTQNLNTLRPDAHSRTFAVYGLFSKLKKQYRKRLIYESYTHLSKSHHPAILNIEELATLYHFPITAVSTTQLEKIESKKGAPPATLPVIEEEESVVE